MYNLTNSDTLLLLRTNITNICKLKGIKLYSIESYLNKSSGYLRSVWNGRIILQEKDLISISEYLGTTPDYLLGLTDNPNSSKLSYDDIITNNRKLKQVCDRLMNVEEEEINKVLAFMDIIGIK